MKSQDQYDAEADIRYSFLQGKANTLIKTIENMRTEHNAVASAYKLEQLSKAIRADTKWLLQNEIDDYVNSLKQLTIVKSRPLISVAKLVLVDHLHCAETLITPSIDYLNTQFHTEDSRQNFIKEALNNYYELVAGVEVCVARQVFYYVSRNENKANEIYSTAINYLYDAIRINIKSQAAQHELLVEVFKVLDT